jgi:hypothetical protein
MLLSCLPVQIIGSHPVPNGFSPHLLVITLLSLLLILFSHYIHMIPGFSFSAKPCYACLVSPHEFHAYFNLLPLMWRTEFYTHQNSGHNENFVYPDICIFKKKTEVKKYSEQNDATKWAIDIYNSITSIKKRAVFLHGLDHEKSIRSVWLPFQVILFVAVGYILLLVLLIG